MATWFPPTTTDGCGLAVTSICLDDGRVTIPYLTPIALVFFFFSLLLSKTKHFHIEGKFVTSK
jgi:hypothetical protein